MFLYCVVVITVSKLIFATTVIFSPFTYSCVCVPGIRPVLLRWIGYCAIKMRSEKNYFYKLHRAKACKVSDHLFLFCVLWFSIRCNDDCATLAE